MALPTAVRGPGRILDAYSVRARWSPVFLVVLPPIVLGLSLIPALPAWNKLWPLAGAAGVVILLDQLGRDAGKCLQPALWASWGGAPTTVALRHRDTSNPVLLARRHQRLAVLTGQAMPTEDDERADPARADNAYESATAVLIAKTRGRSTDFPLIFAENCNYGFRRNMLGLRPWGLRLTSLTGLLALSALAIAIADLTKFPVSLLAVALLVSITAFIIWWRVITPDWVKRVAQSYSERLLEATETLT